MQGTAGLSMLNTRSRSVAPFLSLVYGAHPFRRWWSQQKLSPEMRMCLHWRAHQLNLADHLSDHRRALKVHLENDPFLPYVGPRFCHVSGLNSPKSLFFPNSAKRRIAAVASVQQRGPWQMEKHREQTEQRVATCQALRQMHGSERNGRATDHKQRCKNYFLSSNSGAVSTFELKRWRRLHLFAQKVAQSPTPPTQKWGDSCEACLLIPASATCLR
mgnify:CR=1 FL=1